VRATSTRPDCVTAVYNGAYPGVFKNDLVDGSFGITSKIVLDELRLNGKHVRSLEVPDGSMVTSYSEMALNLSVDPRSVALMGCFAPVNTIESRF